jgi:ATP-dependent helicase/nuclease subunit A
VVAAPEVDAAEDEGPEPRARGIRLGAAFHHIMEAADLGDPERALRQVPESVVRFELDAESEGLLAEMLRTTLGSSLMARARASRAAGMRVLRELPYSRTDPDGEGGLEEGRIDLVFAEGDRWVLVDYKTDPPSGSPPESSGRLVNLYGGQLRAYAAALRSAGIGVTEAYLLMARTGDAVRVDLP